MRYGLILAVLWCAGCGALGNMAEDAVRARAVRAIDERADELGVDLARYGITRDDEPSDALRKILSTEAEAGNSQLVKAVAQARSLTEALAILATNSDVLLDAEKRRAELTASKDVAQKAGGGIATLLAALALGLARVVIRRGKAKVEADGQKTKIEEAFDYVLSRIESVPAAAGRPVKDAIKRPPPGEAATRAAATVAAAVKTRFK